MSLTFCGPAFRAPRAPSGRFVQKLAYLMMATPVVVALPLIVLAPPSPRVFAAPMVEPVKVARTQTVREAERVAPPAFAGVLVKSDTRAPVAPPPEPQVAAVEPAIDAAPKPIIATAKVVLDDAGAMFVDGAQVRLAGVALPKPDAMCRRLDGVEVRCLERIAARLALITQGRKIACEMEGDAAGAPIGRCRADKIDLAQDLLHLKLVERQGKQTPQT